MKLTVPNSIIDNYFQTLEDGTKTFYPAGMFGRRGYIIPSDEKEVAICHKLIRRHVWSLIIYFLTYLILFVFVRPAIADFTPAQYVQLIIATLVFFGPLAWLDLHLQHRKYIKEMQPAHVPNSPVTHLQNMTQSVNPLFPLALSLFIISGGTGMFLGSFHPLALIFVAFGVLLAIPFLKPLLRMLSKLND